MSFRLKSESSVFNNFLDSGFHRNDIFGRNSKLSVDVGVLCHDLPSEAGIDGLLGLNFLKNFDFTVEYSSGRLRLIKIQ